MYWSVSVHRSTTRPAWTAVTPRRARPRLLFGDMTLEQRQRLSRRFGESDWNACRTLSETLLNQYPALCAHMPGEDPYFWRDWERISRPWPMFVALLGMAVGWAIHDQQMTDHTLMESLGMAPTWAFRDRYTGPAHPRDLASGHRRFW